MSKDGMWYEAALHVYTHMYTEKEIMYSIICTCNKIILQKGTEDYVGDGKERWGRLPQVFKSFTTSGVRNTHSIVGMCFCSIQYTTLPLK